jgi:hypothetical protein
MTLITLITLNAVLAAILVHALVSALATAVHKDRETHRAHRAEIERLPEHREDRLAA